jgi:hypothetical protein
MTAPAAARREGDPAFHDIERESQQPLGRGPGVVHWLLAGATVLSIIGSTGCATVRTLSADSVEGEMYEFPARPQSRPRVYAGVYEDILCQKLDSGPGSGQVSAICLADVLFSAIGDTVVLPFTAIQQARFGNFHPRLVEDVHRREEARRQKWREDTSKLCKEMVVKDPGAWQKPCRNVLQPDPPPPEAARTQTDQPSAIPEGGAGRR